MAFSRSLGSSESSKSAGSAIIIKSCVIDELSASQRESLISALCELAKNSLKGMKREYISERMLKYKILTLIQNQKKSGGVGEIVGFSFSDIYFFRFLLISFPVFHCGLAVVGRDFRGRGASVAVVASLYKLLLKKKMLSRFLMILFGLLFTAKCSNPVSFLKIRSFSRRLSWPKIKDEDSLSRLSRAKWSKALSRFLSRRLADQNSEDFILRGVNRESGYRPDKEEYNFHSKTEKTAVSFFRKHIMPDSELITVAWFHPLWLWLQNQNYSFADF